MTTGERIRQARERAGITQVQLARKMYIGPKFIIDVEAGRQQADAPLLGWMEKILGCKAGELKGGGVNDRHDGDADADGGADEPDSADGGGGAAAAAD